MRPGILPEHGFKHKGNRYASLRHKGIEVLRFSSRRETPRSHVLYFRATSGHNVVYMRSVISKEMSRFRLPSSGRRRLLLKVPYVGYTTRHLHQRIGEHKYSAIGRHLEDHGLSKSDLKDEHFSVLRKCRSKFDCLIFEILFKDRRSHVQNLWGHTPLLKPKRWHQYFREEETRQNIEKY